MVRRLESQLEEVSSGKLLQVVRSLMLYTKFFQNMNPRSEKFGGFLSRFVGFFLSVQEYICLMRFFL